VMGNDPYARLLEEDSKDLEKIRMVARPNQRCQKSKIATKIRSKLDILKRDRVKIVLL
jgi:hypothetical protein